ncbi:hypothetical protein [Ascidiimonas sp. W6]|uniref:hypothetical protein n=1 Tax=Ascidiimonas meishanensis TaxID=3128903 RepID=UPI0030ED6BA9
MKKYLVLGVLFVLPLVTYLFFASGVNNFMKLPVLTKGVGEVTDYRSLSGESVSLEGNITILGFFGNDIEFKRGNAFNLNQKIYKRFYEFNDFQFVIVVPDTPENEKELIFLKSELNNLADAHKWKFLFASPSQVQTLFESLQSNYTLDENYGSHQVFIIDKESNLRGRKGDETLYGFDARSVAEINNKMEDDVKVLLAEYRLALKRNNRYQN